MKNLYLLFAALLVCLLGRAQYSNDTLAPLSICNADNNQSAVAAVTDGGSGSFVFWLDKRAANDSAQIYGQHLDANGDAAWAVNGKLIATTTTSIIGFQVTKWQQGMLLAWVQRDAPGYGDSLFCQYVDTAGNFVWAKPSLIANKGNGFIDITQDGFTIMPNDSGATIIHSYTYNGGSSGLSFNRVDFSGNVHWPVLSKTFTLDGYDYRSSSDGKNGFYGLSKGNGIGSTMFIQHFNLQGVPTWQNDFDITSGGSPNGFNGDINMMPDTHGNLYVSWDANGGNVDVTKLTPQGAFAWTPNRVRLSDTSAYSPGRSYARLIGDNVYVTWLESRTPYVGNSIMQKLDTNGAVLWGAGGLVVATVDVYNTYPKIAATDSNAIVNVFMGPANHDMNVQRVRSDSTLTYTGNGKVLAYGNPQEVFYSDYVVLDNATGCNAIFWTSTSYDIYGSSACISYGSIPTGIEDVKNNGATTVTVFPNPASKTITVKNNDGQALNTVTVYDVTGKIVTTVLSQTNSSSVKIDVSQLQPGIYFVQSLTQGLAARNTFVVE